MQNILKMENCTKISMPELSTWSLCKYSTYSCTRAFQNLTELRNHEEICPRINLGPEVNEDGGSVNNVRRLLKDLKVVLKRTDSDKILPIADNKHPDEIQRNFLKNVETPSKDLRTVMKCNSSTKRLNQGKYGDTTTTNLHKKISPPLKDLRIKLKRCDIPTSLLEKQKNETRRSRRSCAQESLKRISQMSKNLGTRTEDQEIESEGENYNYLTDSASDSGSGSESEPESERPQKTTSSRQKGQCKHCDQKFPTRFELGNHTRVVHPKKKRFVCDHEGCTSKFTLLHALMKHKVVHTGIKPFKCPDCPREFFDRSGWRRHKRIHTKEIRYTCKVCDKKFTDTSGGKVHERIVHSKEKNFKCNHCDQCFRFPYSRRQHEKKVHFPNEFPPRAKKTFTCNDCKVEFRSCINLKNHMCNSTFKIVEPEIPIPEMITSDEVEFDPFADTSTIIAETSSRECDKTPGSSTTSKDGLVHVNLQDIVGFQRTEVVYEDDDAAMDIKYEDGADPLFSEIAPVDTLSINSSDSNFQEPNHTQSPAPQTTPDIYDPDIRPGPEEPNHISTEQKPSRGCKSENTLDLIKQFNMGLSSSPENVSTKTDVSPEGAESTILGIKSEIQTSNISGSVTAFTDFPVEPECLESVPGAGTQIPAVIVAGAYVKKKYNVPTRIRTLNSDGHFQCSGCEESFVKVSLLNKHEKIHRPPRPYVCDYPLCEKSFATSEYLSNHKNVHIAEPRFQCKFCNNRYRQPHGLKIHMRTHTSERPYKCEYCDEGFIDLKPKKLHVLRHHTKEKPFKCKWCDKRCFLKDQMRLHERLHTGEKPMRCTYCNKGFRRPNCLRRHEAIHLRAPGTSNVSQNKVRKDVSASTSSSSIQETSATSTSDT